MKTPPSQVVRKLNWPLRILLVAILLFTGIRIFAFVMVGDSAKAAVTAELVQNNPDATNLVVVVHGGRGDKAAMQDVLDVISHERKGADVMFVKFPSRVFSNADCFKISRQIRDAINTRYTAKQLSEKPYANIELVGYSMGALLLRKAYVYGYGATQDCPPAENAGISKSAETFPQDWVKKVDRFVLLAGMNRGWTTRPQPKGATFKELWVRFEMESGKFIGWATNTAGMIRQCERGEPFVANLRMQWLEVLRKKELEAESSDSARTTRGLTVVQLLGDIDDRVSAEDSRDVSVAQGFVWVQMNQTSHETSIEFKGSAIARARAERFKEAFDDKQIERLRRMNPAKPTEEDENVVEAVIILHGIRDRGEWTSGFERQLQDHFLKRHPDDDKKLLIYRPTYGYFPMGSFLLGNERSKNVRWFMDEMTELKARYPKLTDIHFIGHSNGTYVLAKALQDYKALRIKKIILAGSVLPKTFNWTDPALRDRFDKVQNYSGRGDWVVGWFPRLFEFRFFTGFKGPFLVA